MVLTKDHYLELKDGVFDGTSKDDLDNLFKTLATDPHRDKIVLHFHGGLVDVARAMQTAEPHTALPGHTYIPDLLHLGDGSHRGYSAGRGGARFYRSAA